MFDGRLVEKLEEPDSIQYNYKGKTVFEVNSIKYASLDWRGINLSLDDKKKLLLNIVDFKYPNLAEYLLDEKQLKEIMKRLERRFRTSYSDIMIGIICLYSMDEFYPSFNGDNDYDDYCRSIKMAINNSELAYVRKYGYR